MVRVRFAPSPTGPLHIGGARTALFNYLFARAKGGSFILRIDDTDVERSRKEYEEDIVRGLEWLGISWDEGPGQGGASGPYKQSERTAFYQKAGEKLLADKKAYQDKEGTIRLRYPATEVIVDDRICGECKFSVSSLGPEPVLFRADGSPTYHLASVVDDIEMKISHVIRGQDHLTNTAKHVFLFRGLGHEPPTFAHLPLILGKEGGKLSKRNSEALVSVREFQEAGYLPEALLNFMMLLGWSHPEALEQISLDEAMKSFSLERVGKTGAIFDSAKLNWLNGWWLRHLPIEKVAEEGLAFSGEYKDQILHRGERFWREFVLELRDSMELLADIRGLLQLVFSIELDLHDEAKELLQTEGSERVVQVISQWIRVLEEHSPEPDKESYTKEQFSQLSALLKKEVGFGGKPLFQALRIAVMGALSGPELKVLVPLISQNTLYKRAKLTLEKVKNLG